MRKKLMSLMPEFQLIRDPDLKEKTIHVWEAAIKLENWSLSDLLEMPFTLLIEQRTVNIVDHTRAVTQCSLKIAEVLQKEYQGKIAVNRDHLLSGALLHDVGKLFEYQKKKGGFQKSEKGKLLRHPISGAAFAYKFDLPQEVLHIIACHSKEGDGVRNTVEAVIVNHADFVNFDVLRI